MRGVIMKLDEIQDIEVLRNVLKSVMLKCIKETELEGCGNKRSEKIKTMVGEYYFYEYYSEYGDFTISDGEGHLKDFDDGEVNEYFEFPKEGDA
jgi:hypothetical protein